MLSLLELFCELDDFDKRFTQALANKQLGKDRRRGPACRLSDSEIMTIVIYFHESGYRNFKDYYTKYVSKQLTSEFPALLSYNRFVELMPRVLLALCAYLQENFGMCTGINFVDSTSIAVCHNKRIPRNKVFAGLAERGCTSMGWFFGFKLHLIINDKGDLLAVYLTLGNTDDRKPLSHLTRDLFGKLFGDKGYISQALFETLLSR